MIMYRGLILFNHLLLLISTFTVKSDAISITHILRQLAANSRPFPDPELPLQISPSPSPSPAAPAPLNLPKTDQPVTMPNNKPVVSKPNTEPVVSDTCDKMSKKCHLNMLTACLGIEGSLLLVLNEADTSLNVSVTVFPGNITYKDIDVPRHHAKKVNISDSVRGSSSIVLHAGNENCIIHMGAVVPKDNINPQFPALETYITPINGAYVLFASILIIGGTLACFKSWRGRHTRPDGIPYQELELRGQSDLVSSENVENAEGWDQRWDDDWDEEKGVKSASATSGRSSAGNGNISRYSSDGWRNDWDD